MEGTMTENTFQSTTTYSIEGWFEVVVDRADKTAQITWQGEPPATPEVPVWPDKDARMLHDITAQIYWHTMQGQNMEENDERS
jgi:hypothetical protein